MSKGQPNKIHVKVSNSNIDGSRIINLDKLKTSLMEIISHTGLCDKAREVVNNGDCAAILESGKRNRLSVILDARCNDCSKLFFFK